jgi:hypothetical protein
MRRSEKNAFFIFREDILDKDVLLSRRDWRLEGRFLFCVALARINDKILTNQT